MQIRTQYRAVLILSITIQLAFFFIVASAGLWLDQLINGIISQITKRKVGCEVLTLVVLVVSSYLNQGDKLRLTIISAIDPVARTGTKAFNPRDLILIWGSIGVDLRPQRTTDTDGGLPQYVCPLLGKLGCNVRRCQFPLDLPRMAFLQPYGLSFRGVNFIGPYHWNYLPIGIRQGSP